MKEGKWQRNKFIGVELFNKVLGIIGLGKIGSRVAQVAKAIGMKVLVYDPFISKQRAEELDLRTVGLEEIWRQADFITLHIPKTNETTNLISGTVLSRIKPGVRIINASRGGVIDEAALARAISDGRVAGAALDVFDTEPPKDSPLLAVKDKIILTPHLGASTVEAQYNVAIDLAEQIRDYLIDGVCRSPVNLPFMRPDILKNLGKYFGLAEAMGAIAGGLITGSVRGVEILNYGALAVKDTTPLTVAALTGLFRSRIESVTYVNAQIIAKSHGISVRESRLEDSGAGNYREELGLIISSDEGIVSMTGTVLAHNEAIITKINDHPINLTPSKFMLFTMHQDRPGMVAKVATILGDKDINISTMSVGRVDIRQHAIMVLTLDDPIEHTVVEALQQQDGIHLARFISLSVGSAALVH